MGVGKSSLINLIAGKDVTKASSSAQSCILNSTEHTIRLTNYLDVHLYDTVSKHNYSHNLRDILSQNHAGGAE
jgi:ribosome biogenesis GTPase A